MNESQPFAYEFGPFRLIPKDCRLLREGRPVTLAPKDFEILLALIRRAGGLAEKGDLLKEIWPDTFVEEANLSRHVYALRRTLGEDEAGQTYIETIPKRGYRFAAEIREIGNGETAHTTFESIQTLTQTRVVVEEQIEGASPQERALVVPAIGRAARLSRSLLICGLVLMVAAIAVGSYYYFRPKPTLTERDFILIADFENKTGDQVFDGTLKQALAVQLGQSPFLGIFSDERTRETLRYMGKQDERVTRDLAREICQRQGIKAFIAGSIASLGSHYAISVDAVDAQSGNTNARAALSAALPGCLSVE